MEKLRKRCNSQEKLLIKVNKPNALNKRRKNHLSSTPDSSLLISISIPQLPETSLSKNYLGHTDAINKEKSHIITRENLWIGYKV